MKKIRSVVWGNASIQDVARIWSAFECSFPSLEFVGAGHLLAVIDERPGAEEALTFALSLADYGEGWSGRHQATEGTVTVRPYVDDRYITVVRLDDKTFRVECQYERPSLTAVQPVLQLALSGRYGSLTETWGWRGPKILVVNDDDDESEDVAWAGARAHYLERGLPDLDKVVEIYEEEVVAA